MTPVFVQRLSYAQSSKTAGTAAPTRICRYLIKTPKVTQNDWVVSATYLPSATADTLVNVSGYTVDSSQNAVQETFTYTHTGDKITMTSSTVGTTYIEVVVLE